MTLRLACTEDAAALLAIYTPYIIGTTVTFELSPPTEAEFATRIATTLPQYPYLVCEEHGTVVGYAYAGRVGARAAFNWSVELSVYLAPQAQGKGYGETLYTTLLRLLTAQGYRYACGRIALPNPASCHLHEKLGFRPVGVQQQVGHKLGTWVDLAIYEKTLGSPVTPPVPIRPVTEIVALCGL